MSVLWEERSPSSRGPKPALSPERVARAAIAIADAEGLAAVSIQRVAAEFGFTTMALYRYVPSKTALVELMIDNATSGPPDLGPPGRPWREKLESWTRRCAELYRQHPWILQAIPARRRIIGPNEVAWLDAAMAALAEAGLSPPDQRHAFLVLIGLVRAAAQQELDAAGAADDPEWGATMSRILEKHGSRYPALLFAIRAGAFEPSEEDSLEFGLRCVLDGLEQRAGQR